MCTNDHGYFLLVINTSWSFPHSWLIIGFITMLTRRVPLVEQELLSLPEHLGSHPVLWCSCYSIFSFVCMFYRSLFVLLYFFFLAIVLSVLRFTDSDYPFGISKPFLKSSLGWPLWTICVINDHGYVPLIENTSQSFPHSWCITGFVPILTRRVPLVEQELLTLPEHLTSPSF